MVMGWLFGTIVLEEILGKEMKEYRYPLMYNRNYENMTYDNLRKKLLTVCGNSPSNGMRCFEDQILF